MPRSHKGVTKVAQRVRGKIVHPNSRKAQKLSSAALRKDKMMGQKSAANKLLYQKGVMFSWFLQQLQPEKARYTEQEVAQMIQQYIARDDEELAALKEAAKQTVSQRSRELMLESRRAQELSQLESGQGFEAPDLTSAETVDRLREWDGALKTIYAIKTHFFRVPSS